MYQKHRDDEDMQRENCNRLSDLAGDAEEEENATTKEKSAREEDEQQTRRKCAYGNAWDLAESSASGINREQGYVYHRDGHHPLGSRSIHKKKMGKFWKLNKNLSFTKKKRS